ncbi:MAG: hypothetical protein ACR2FG_05775 [Marmoricola sp.]
MKQTILALGIALALLLTTAGCGGLSKDEKKASASISKEFAGPKASPARKKVADCFGDKLVSEAGVEQLQKDKLIDKKLAAASTPPKKLSKKSAEAYGDGLVSCFTFSKLKGDIKKTSPGATDAQVDAYTTCLDAISDKDLKQAIVDGYTTSKETAAAKKVNAATQTCQKKLGS